MVDSKFKAYAIFAIIISIFLVIGICFFIYVLISVIFLGGHILKRGTLSQIDAVIAIIFLLSLLFLILNSLKRYAYIIKVDNYAKTIEFKNIFTQNTTCYLFSDFDSYLDTYAETRGGSYKVLYLLKENKAEKIITGFYYSNIEELQNSLSSIQYLGFKKEFGKLAIRALMNKPIIDK